MASPASQASFTADLRHQAGQANRATLLLEQAVATLRDGEDLHEHADQKAQRLRGAVVLVTSAAIELAVSCGWLEAAHSAEVGGLLETAEPGG